MAFRRGIKHKVSACTQDPHVSHVPVTRAEIFCGENGSGVVDETQSDLEVGSQFPRKKKMDYVYRWFCLFTPDPLVTYALVVHLLRSTLFTQRAARTPEQCAELRRPSGTHVGTGREGGVRREQSRVWHATFRR